MGETEMTDRMVRKGREEGEKNWSNILPGV